MDLSQQSPIFDKLLSFCPWAERHWSARNDLLRSGKWNVNSINQGGNLETREWLKHFIPARTSATYALVSASPREFENWSRGIAALANQVLTHEVVSRARPGSPMKQISETSFSVNRDTFLEEYSTGQFKADFLLLSQSSLRDQEVLEQLDITGKIFPVGLDTQGTTFLSRLVAHDAWFGAFSNFSSATFSDTDFSGCHFGDAYFTMSRFKGKVAFRKAMFSGPATFTASFQGPTDFTDADFQAAAHFDGALFEEQPDFSGAVFRGRTSFADATFEASAKLASASFPGKVSVSRIPDDVRQEIMSADHP